MSMPKQKPGQSKQDYGTPWELIRSVELSWGPIDWDLAASPHNAKCDKYLTEEIDSLSVIWSCLLGTHMWLNPEYANIAPWAAKCQAEVAQNPSMRISFLVPASIGTNWFERFVYPCARVIALKPRLVFDGMEPNPKTGKVDPYPKDLMICRFGEPPGLRIWNWKAGRCD